PPGEGWDKLREITDTNLFFGYKEEIRFAALSITGRGVERYGRYSIVLRDEMIAHRATIFEENSVMWMKHHRIQIWDANNLPRGNRATWADRDKLAGAKLGHQVHGPTTVAECAALLLRDGPTGADDEFIEVHIFGPLSVRSFAKVILSEPSDDVEEVLARDLSER